jgi:hypothetical protein
METESFSAMHLAIQFVICKLLGISSRAANPARQPKTWGRALDTKFYKRPVRRGIIL